MSEKVPRVIYEVDAWTVDKTGSHNHLEGFPVRFDSKQNNNDIDKTLRKAKAKFHHTVGDMYDNNAERQVQTCVLYNVHGAEILCESIGEVADVEVAT